MWDNADNSMPVQWYSIVRDAYSQGDDCEQAESRSTASSSETADIGGGGKIAIAAGIMALPMHRNTSSLCPGALHCTPEAHDTRHGVTPFVLTL